MIIYIVHKVSLFLLYSCQDIFFPLSKIEHVENYTGFNPLWLYGPAQLRVFWEFVQQEY